MLLMSIYIYSIFLIAAKEAAWAWGLKDVTGDENQPSTMMTLSANAIRGHLYVKRGHEFDQFKQYIVASFPENLIKMTRIRNWEILCSWVFMGFDLIDDVDMY